MRHFNIAFEFILTLFVGVVFYALPAFTGVKGTQSILIMNILLLIIYLLYYIKKRSFNDTNVATCHSLSILSVIVFLFVICISLFWIEYIKTLARVAIVCYLVFSVFLITYALYSERKQNLVSIVKHVSPLLFRCILLLLVNISVLIYVKYQAKSVYKGSCLQQKEVFDGIDYHVTYYCDSVKTYVTQSFTFDRKADSSYHYSTYYKLYPNIIERIDTIESTKGNPRNLTNYPKSKF